MTSRWSPRASRRTGRHSGSCDFDEPVRHELRAGHAVDTHLGLLIPLVAHDVLIGLIGIEGTRISSPVRAMLGSLAYQAALALESAALSENLMRRESEARLGSLVRNSSELVLVVDPDTTITYVSPAVKRVLGRAARGCHGPQAVGHDDALERHAPDARHGRCSTTGRRAAPADRPPAVPRRRHRARRRGARHRSDGRPERARLRDQRRGTSASASCSRTSCPTRRSTTPSRGSRTARSSARAPCTPSTVATAPTRR